MICEHSLTEFCSCVERRPPVYVAPHVELRGPGERLAPWTCRCTRPDGRRLLRKYRHTSEWGCLPQAEIDAWRARSGCGPQTARQLYWLAKNFAPKTPSLAVKGA